VPRASLTFPLGINNRGQVVGMYRDADQVAHGFLFDDGAITTIDHPLAASDSRVQDLSDRGQLVGFYERGAPASPVAGLAAAGTGGSARARVQTWGPRWGD
jgi:probable HAF family extracellular repeat protein